MGMVSLRKHTGLKQPGDAWHWGFSLIANRKILFFWRFDFSLSLTPAWRGYRRFSFTPSMHQLRVNLLGYFLNVRFF